MKALVTGGAGFVGTNLIKRLSNNNHVEYRENIIVSVDNYSTGLKENEIDCPGVEYFDVDIANITDYSAMIQDCDVIFHLAALPRIQPSFETPTQSFESNVRGTQNILEWARKNGNIPVIYAGSSSTHGGVYSNPYTHTKWQGEELCKMYNKIYNLPVTICRFYNVYGPHQLTEGEYCTVLSIFERQYKSKKPLTITWDGEQKRDFTHVQDIVDGLVLTDRTNSWGLTIELGRGINYTINELADMFGKDYPREYIDKRPGEMRSTLCDTEVAYSTIGYHPFRDIKDYIKGYILRK
jgi:UDP-glucose 4-epimerase